MGNNVLREKMAAVDVSTKKIMREMKEMAEDHELEASGIYVRFDETNMRRARALIVGPSDTPYAGGFYFFDITYPDDYPFSPPKMIHMTRTGRVRFNPNLYTCGKICLSLLNTWNGPRWTPCNTLSSVLKSIQAMVLVGEPLRNEPGYERGNDARVANYSDVVTYHNITFSIIRMLTDQIPSFEIFGDTVRTYFLRNYKMYQTHINSLVDKWGAEKRTFLDTSYGMEVKNVNYTEVKDTLYELGNTLARAYPPTLEITLDKSLSKLLKAQLIEIADAMWIPSKKIVDGISIYKTKVELVKDILASAPAPAPAPAAPAAPAAPPAAPPAAAAPQMMVEEVLN